MANITSEIVIKTERRLCTVGKSNIYGYFHIWEYNQDTGKIFGLVEFPGAIRRIDPEEIHFDDEENVYLRELNKIL